jgi:hypothetical protein
MPIVRIPSSLTRSKPLWADIAERDRFEETNEQFVPTRGVVGIVIDAVEAAKHIERAFGNAGVTTETMTKAGHCCSGFRRAIVDAVESGGGLDAAQPSRV